MVFDGTLPSPAEGVAPDSERVKRTYGGYAALSAR
jgi:hypothetical protein